MNTTGNNRALKVITAVLVILLMGLGIYTLKFYNSVQDNERSMAREKEVIELELRDILSKYNEEISGNKMVEQELSTAKGRVEQLLDSLDTSPTNRDVLINYRKAITHLREQRDLLLKKTDSLVTANASLENDKRAVTTAYTQTLEERDSLKKKNEQLQDSIKTAAGLGIGDLSASGIILRRSGTRIPNDLAKRIDKIEVCYTLSGKPTAQKTDALIYIQIIAPDARVLGERATVNFGSETLIYSATEELGGIDSDMQHCVRIDPLGEKFQEGIYHVNVFEDERLLGSSVLELR